MEIAVYEGALSTSANSTLLGSATSIGSGSSVYLAGSGPSTMTINQTSAKSSAGSNGFIAILSPDLLSTHQLRLFPSIRSQMQMATNAVQGIVYGGYQTAIPGQGVIHLMNASLEDRMPRIELQNIANFAGMGVDQQGNALIALTYQGVLKQISGGNPCRRCIEGRCKKGKRNACPKQFPICFEESTFPTNSVIMRITPLGELSLEQTMPSNMTISTMSINVPSNLLAVMGQSSNGPALTVFQIDGSVEPTETITYPDLSITGMDLAWDTGARCRRSKHHQNLWVVFRTSTSYRFGCWSVNCEGVPGVIVLHYHVPGMYLECVHFTPLALSSDSNGVSIAADDGAVVSANTRGSIVNRKGVPVNSIWVSDYRRDGEWLLDGFTQAQGYPLAVNRGEILVSGISQKQELFAAIIRRCHCSELEPEKRSEDNDDTNSGEESNLGGTGDGIGGPIRTDFN